MNVAWWVVRHKLTSASAIARLVDDAAALGITDLVAQVRGHADAYYTSELEPRAEELAGSDLDPLALLCDRAHARGLRVHAWVNVFFVWSHPLGEWPRDPAHLVNRHPEWLLDLEPGGGADYEGLYADPRHEAARAHTVAVCRDLASRYPIDGLHLDYVRYPRDTYAPSPDAHAFVTEFVRRCVDAVRPLPVSAAVFPDPRVAAARVLQRWTTWPLQVACPMAYRESTDEVRQLLRAARAAWGGTLWAGLFGYEGEPDLLAAQVRVARGCGAEGMILFRYEPEWRELLRAFSAAARG